MMQKFINQRIHGIYQWKTCNIIKCTKPFFESSYISKRIDVCSIEDEKKIFLFLFDDVFLLYKIHLLLMLEYKDLLTFVNNGILAFSKEIDCFASIIIYIYINEFCLLL